MSEQKKWDYRVVRTNKEDGTPANWYSIQEVYYDDETGDPNAQSIDLQVEGEDNEEMLTQLKEMMSAVEKPILNENDIVKSKENDEQRDISSQMFASVNGSETESSEINLEDKTLLNSLKIENAELKDMLRNKGVDVV